MEFFRSSFRFLLKLTLFGFFFRTLVAFYLGLWSLKELSSISESFSAFFYGWHFDVAVAGIFYFIIFGSHLIFQFGKKTFRFLYFVALLAYSFFITADALYAKESGRHISYEVYNLFSIQGSLGNLVAQYGKEVIFAVVIALLLSSRLPVPAKPVRGIFTRALSLVLVLALSLTLCRGVESIPQDPSWAYRAGGGAKGATLALNGAYGIIWALLAGKKFSQERIEIQDETKSEEIFTTWRELRGIQKPLAQFDGNIIIIFLEGWPGVYTDKKVEERELLPFFNSLRQNSLHTDLMLAGGHRTTEGLFATLCGLPNPLGKSIMFSEIENKEFSCFPEMLGFKQYDSAFFQGSDQYTSGVGLLALKTGFQKSFGKNEIPEFEKLDRNSWGVYDKDLYKFVSQKMDTMQEPLLIGVNTNTTHDLQLPPGTERLFDDNSEIIRHFNVAHYADSELRDFYKHLKSRQWKKDWLLILVADHTSFAARNIFEHYSIPFLMKYHSANPEKPSPAPFEEKKVTGAWHQIDIGTTLVDLTGLNAPHFIGRSMLRPGEFSEGASLFHLGQSVWFKGPWAVVFNIRAYGKKQCYLWQTDMSFQNDTPCPAEADQWYLEGLSYLKGSQNILFQ